MYYLLNSNLSGAQSTQITNPCRTCSLFHSRHPFYGVGTSQLHHIWKKKKGKIHIAVIWAKKTRNKSLHLFPSKGILKDVTMVKTLSPHEGFVVIPVATDSSPHVSRTLRVWTFEEYSTFLSAGKLLQASQQEVKIQITGGSAGTDGCGTAARLYLEAFIYPSPCYYFKQPIYFH